jgi:hypothetical protein
MDISSRLPADRRASEVLDGIAASAQGERVSLGDIMASLEQRAFALLMVVLGLPNILPMPPPIPLLCGFFLVFIALQIVVGRHQPWIPRRALGLSVPRERLDVAISRATPVLRKLERFSRPRLLNFLPVAWELRVAGTLLLIVSLGLVCAAPVIGQIPMGISVCLMGLALVEHDGLIMIGAVFFGALGLVLNFGFILAIIKGIMSLASG